MKPPNGEDCGIFACRREIGRPGEQARITAAGFDVFRQKPIDPVNLAHEVVRLAKHRTASSGMFPEK